VEGEVCPPIVEYGQCIFRTAVDGVMSSRRWDEGANCRSRGGILAGVVGVVDRAVQDASGHIRTRVRMVEGREVDQAFRVVVEDARGRSRRY